MDVNYNKLFKLLIDKGLKKTEFAKQVGISPNNENIGNREVF